MPFGFAREPIWLRGCRRRPRQRPNRRRLVVQADVRVDAQREPDFAVVGPSLGHLGRR